MLILEVDLGLEKYGFGVGDEEGADMPGVSDDRADDIGFELDDGKVGRALEGFWPELSGKPGSTGMAGLMKDMRVLTKESGL